MSHTANKQPELLPCPFCGGPATMEEVRPVRSRMDDQQRWWGVVCHNTINLGGSCAIQQRPSASIEAAAARWNLRNPSPAPAPVRAPLSQEAARRLVWSASSWLRSEGVNEDDVLEVIAAVERAHRIGITNGNT